MRHLLLHSLAYKAWANKDLFPLVLGLTAPSQAEERHKAVRLLNHIHVVDSIFQAHLSARPHGHTGLNTADTPDAADLFAAQAALDQWLIEHTTGLSDARLNERLDFSFVDGKPGRMSRAEMLMHLITHGSYHRGAVGRILFQLEVQPPPETLTVFMHQAA